MKKFITSIALGMLMYTVAIMFTALVVNITGWSEEGALRFTISILIGIIGATLMTGPWRQ